MGLKYFTLYAAPVKGAHTLPLCITYSINNIKINEITLWYIDKLNYFIILASAYNSNS